MLSHEILLLTITLLLISLPFKFKITAPDKSLLPLLYEFNIIDEPIPNIVSQNLSTQTNQSFYMNESFTNKFQENNDDEPDDYESFSEVSVSDDEQELLPVNNASIITELPFQTLNIIETRDSLLQQK